MVDKKRRQGAGNGNAGAAADSAVAKLSGASDYEKDIVWQWAYNLAAAGQWQWVSHVSILKANSASSLVDLVGTANGTATGGAHSAQIGWVLAAADYIGFPWRTDLIGGSDDRNYVVGFQLSALTVPGAGSFHGIFGAADGGASLVSTNLVRNNTASRYQWSVSSFFGNAIDTVSVANDFIGKLVSMGGANGSNALALRNARGPFSLSQGDRRDYSPTTAYGIGANFSNGVPAATPTVPMTVEFAFAADARLNMVVFAAETERMLAELSFTAHAFTNMLGQGDSIDAGLISPPAGYSSAGYLNYVTRANVYIEAGGGQLLSTIASDVANQLDVDYPAADSYGGGGGINDISLGASAAAVISDIDDIVAVLDARSRIRYVYLRNISPIGGRWVAQFDPPQQALFQAVIDEVNQYIDDLVAARSNYFVLDSYTLLESNSPSFATYIEGIYRLIPTGDALTNGTKGNFTMDGLHTTEAGALVLSGSADAGIKAMRYYKGNRP